MSPLGFAAAAQTTLGSITTGSSGCTFTSTVCEGDTVHFTPQNTGTYTNYHWYFSTLDSAKEITATTAAGFNVVSTNFTSNFPTINIINAGGTYILTAEYASPTGCKAINDTLIINYNPKPVANPASSALCETTFGGGNAAFTLTNLDGAVTGGASGVTVSYHVALTDAKSGSNALTSPYTSSSSNIYARVLKNTSGCYNTAPVILTVSTIPTAPSAVNEIICQGAIIAPLTATVSGTNVSVNWYDAATGGNLLKSKALSYTPTVAGTFYAEAIDTITNCIASQRTPIQLIINPTPDILGIVTRVDSATCTGTNVNSDGKIVIKNIVNGNKFAYSTNGSLGLFYATATFMSTDSAVIINQSSPATPTVYTIRIYGTDSTCYKDVTAILNPTQCPCQITASWIQNACNNNGTQALSSDDYFTVTTAASSINSGSSGKYEVVMNNTVLNAGGTTYGQSVTVGGAGIFNSDGNTVYQLTVRDLNNKLCVSTIFTTAASASCSTLGCPPNVICLPVQTLRQKK